MELKIEHNIGKCKSRDPNGQDLQKVHVLLSQTLALLLFVLRRMFFHHVSLEIRGLSALVVAVSTGKGLLTSVRSHVSF